MSQVATSAESQEFLVYGLVAEEVRAAVRAGRPADVEALVRDHPELADQIRQLVPTLMLVQQMAGAEDGTSHGSPLSGSDVPQQLGDFRILRQVGRGGMGIVYEAQQLSLGRRVALKVLPFAATMDPHQLHRFQNEARAAASLEHPHIVPVYGVGCERGVHFYAMKFIEGESLARLIEQARSPASGGREPPGAPSHRGAHTSRSPEDAPRSPEDATAPVAAARTERAPRDAAAFRQIAEWGIQAAEALEHAHSVGIVHRDIKPANVMIDGHGSLWVADFGLARTATDAGLTMTGDVVGTLRYMSPEQALAKHGLVDHRTDVYSLGVTLYELLTGAPAVGGKDREQILNAITLEEPRAPRKMDPAIPQDLETIVLKAMAKEPNERYATAKELADDLRRFLENRPVVARRPSSLERAVKWARRQKAIVRAVSVGLAIAIVALAASTILSWRAYQSEAEQRRLADERYREAREQRKLAVEQRRQARQAVDTMYLEVAEKWLQRQPQMGELQKQFLEKVLGYYRAFAEEEGEDEEARYDKATAYFRVGQLLVFALAKGDQAEVPLSRAKALLEELAKEFPNKGLYTLKLAQVVERLPSSPQNQRKNQEQAVSLLEGLVERYPQEPEYRHVLAMCLVNLGDRLTLLGELRNSEIRCRRGVTLLEDLVRSPFLNPRHQITLGNARGNLADTQLQAGNWVQAVENYRKAIAAFESVIPNSSVPPDYQQGLLPFDWHNLGVNCELLGTTLGHLGRLDEAQAALTKAIRIHAKLVADFPIAGHYWTALFRDYRDKGTMFWLRGQSSEADKAYGQAVEFGDRMAAALPPEELTYFAEFLVTCPDPKWWNAKRAREFASKATERSPGYADGWTVLGIAAYRMRDYESAVAALEEAISLKGERYITGQFFIAMAYWQLGDKRQAHQWFEKATSYMTANGWRRDDLLRFRAEAAALMGIRESPSPGAEKERGSRESP